MKNNNLLFQFILVCSFCLAASNVFAVTYYCEPTKRVDPEKEWSKEEIKKWKFSTKLEDMGDKAVITRCSFSSKANKVTCDSYKVDHIERTPSPDIKKYYYFKGQMDLQILSGLHYVENNGRETIRWGKCRITSP